MYNKLSNQERKGLIVRHPQECDGNTRDRIKTVLACDYGYGYDEIAKVLLLDDETIHRHINDYHNNSGKLNIESGGSESKFT